ncbi:helix-turn-helix domain-containing protein [Eubacterium sp.]|uniref:helix-turn-helix domain-containing protein n=1 Tax=Eubacterium sp. TaxID=142586 RepID=UPI002FC8EEDA
MELGEKIKEIRKRKGMLQSLLSEKAGLSMRTLQRYESGEREPTFKTVRKIAEALEVDPWEIVGFNDIEIEAGYELIYGPSPKELIYGSKKDRINAAFDQLNEPGQEKAVEQVEILTKVPEYQRTTDQE